MGEGGEGGGEGVQIYIKQSQQVTFMIQWVMMMMKKFTIQWMMMTETHSPAIFSEVGGVEAEVGITPGQVEAGVGITPGHHVDQVDQFPHNNLNTDPRSS